MRGLADWARRSLPRPRSRGDVLALALLAATAAFTLYGGYWYGRHGVSIWRLRRGVGETMFSAPRQALVPLDEHRPMPPSPDSPHLNASSHRGPRSAGIRVVPAGPGRACCARRGGGLLEASHPHPALARTLSCQRATLLRRGSRRCLALLSIIC